MTQLHPLEEIYVDGCRVTSLESQGLSTGRTFCNDVVIDKDSGLAFHACDPFQPAFYPPYEMYNASGVHGEGGIWLYDTNIPAANFQILS